MNRERLLLMIWLMGSPVLAAHRALLVGIGHYLPGRTGTSAARDQCYMKQMLHDQAFDDLTILTDNQATAQGIRLALSRLLQRCQPGDQVVFHYAGHGTQLPDQNGDEGDGWDEAIVPYDAPRSTKATPTNSRLFIRDDELAIFLSRVRDKLGPAGHILLLMDACHSGTLTRGRARLRTDQHQVRPVPIPKNGLSDWFDPIPAFSRQSGRSGKVILMAGSQAAEPNYETLDDEQQAVGSLTYAFCRAMMGIAPTDTYQSLFERVKAELRQKVPEQRPTLEGDVYERVWAGEVRGASVWAGVQRLGQQTMQWGKGLLTNAGTGPVSRGDCTTLLRDLTLPNAPLQATLNLQNARLTPDQRQLRDTLPTLKDKGLGVFRPGQQAWLRVVNTGNSPFYFALIDVQPDDRTTMLLPGEAYAAPDLYLAPGGQMAFPVSRFAPPYGLETYKLLLTANPVDWSVPLLGRGPISPLLPVAEMGVATLKFWIKPVH